MWLVFIHNFRTTDAALTLPSNSGLINFKLERRGNRWRGGGAYLDVRPSIAFTSVHCIGI